MNPRTLMGYLYPRLLAVHDLDDRIALPQMVQNEDGTIVEKILMPECMRDSYFNMEAGGVYLIGKHCASDRHRVYKLNDYAITQTTKR